MFSLVPHVFLFLNDLKISKRKARFEPETNAIEIVSVVTRS